LGKETSNSQNSEVIFIGHHFWVASSTWGKRYKLANNHHVKGMGSQWRSALNDNRGTTVDHLKDSVSPVVNKKNLKQLNSTTYMLF